MHSTAYMPVTTSAAKSPSACLACGTPLRARQRRYCTAACRQHLMISLNRRTGLLRALNTRYATFSFNEWIIFMDLLPYGMEKIHSYLLPRSPGKKPVEDFCALCNTLGSAWWREKNRTHKRYVASQLILDRADSMAKAKECVIPRSVTLPAVGVSNLIRLELGFTDLTGRPDIEISIKQAYRRQAKKHHPDLGGSAQAFRKIQEAYEKLIEWAQKPSYRFKSGFPEKWLYEGATSRWIQPTAPPRTGR